jgi:transposase
MVYSKEFRGEVLAACDAQLGTRAVALKFNVSESWVRRVKQERRERGKVGPATTRRRTPRWAVEADRIRAAIAKQPDLTLSELQRELETSLSRMTLCRALKQLRLTLKKSV